MKPKEKTVDFDLDLQEALKSTCDTALRAAGLQAFPSVRKLIEAITSAPERKRRRRGK